MATTSAEKFILLTGPLFISGILNWLFLGTLAVQVYLYYTSRYRDVKWVQYLVGSIFFLDILQTVFATHCIWVVLILGWGNPNSFAFPPWTATTFPIMSGLIGGMVQMFFAWRIWIITKGLTGRITAVLIVLLALTQAISATVAAIRSAFIEILDVGILFPGFTVWLAGSLACDLLIAVSMLAILHASRNSFEPTSNLIDRLMIRAVHSGAITAVVALAELILFLILPDTFVHDVPAIILGKLYSNVLLANLNGRRKNDTTYSSANHLTIPRGGHMASLRLEDRHPTTERTIVVDSSKSGKADSLNDLSSKSNILYRPESTV